VEIAAIGITGADDDPGSETVITKMVAHMSVTTVPAMSVGGGGRDASAQRYNSRRDGKKNRLLRHSLTPQIRLRFVEGAGFSRR
jgi:hypothetical protein